MSDLSGHRVNCTFGETSLWLFLFQLIKPVIQLGLFSVIQYDATVKLVFLQCIVLGKRD